MASQTQTLFFELQTQNLCVFQRNVINMWGANGNMMARSRLTQMEIDSSKMDY